MFCTAFCGFSGIEYGLFWAGGGLGGLAEGKIASMTTSGTSISKTFASRHGFRIVWPPQDFRHLAPAQSAKVQLLALAPARQVCSETCLNYLQLKRKMTKHVCRSPCTSQHLHSSEKNAGSHALTSQSETEVSTQSAKTIASTIQTSDVDLLPVLLLVLVLRIVLVMVK